MTWPGGKTSGSGKSKPSTKRTGRDDQYVACLSCYLQRLRKHLEEAQIIVPQCSEGHSRKAIRKPIAVSMTSRAGNGAAPVSTAPDPRANRNFHPRPRCLAGRGKAGFEVFRIQCCWHARHAEVAALKEGLSNTAPSAPLVPLQNDFKEQKASNAAC